MQFQDLPQLGATPLDQTEILVGANGEAVRTKNLFSETMDAEVVRLVLNKVTPNSTLDQHIADQSIHTRLDDTIVSPNTTWSSSRVTSAIAGSSAWFNLDSVPEGVTNKYFTEQRAKDVIAATTMGVTLVDHRAIATQLASVLLGFNSTTFRYTRENVSGSVTVSVDGATATTNYFDITPGVHTVTFTGGLYEKWICEELAHAYTPTASGSQQVTPKLTLDSFTEGTTNKFWNSNTFGGSTEALAIKNHLTDTALHPQISDNSSDPTTIWSSSKIINYVSSEIAKNRQAVAANSKTVMLAHEIASSGQNPTGYVWDSALSGSTYTHYISRPLGTIAYNSADSASGSIYSTINLPPGTWLFYWDADMTLRTGVFASVTGSQTYIALNSTLRVPVLTAPGVITNSTLYTVAYSMVSKFNTTTPYNSTYNNTWLQPQSIAGVPELYATLHIERVR